MTPDDQPKAKGITQEQHQFAKLLLEKNPEQTVTDCWIEVYIKAKGKPIEDDRRSYYSKMASRSFCNPRFKVYMENLKNGTTIDKAKQHEAKIAEVRTQINQVKISEQKILFEAACIAFADPANIYDDHGNLLPKHQWPEVERRAISKIKKTTYRDKSGAVTGDTVEVTFWDKTQALDKLMKNMGLFLADNKQRSNTMSDLPKEKRDLLIALLSGERPDVVSSRPH